MYVCFILHSFKCFYAWNNLWHTFYGTRGLCTRGEFSLPSPGLGEAAMFQGVMLPRDSRSSCEVLFMGYRWMKKINTRMDMNEIENGVLRRVLLENRRLAGITRKKESGMPALGQQRQSDIGVWGLSGLHSEFQAGWGYVGWPCLKQTNEGKGRSKNT